jgi:predicted DNA-binding transcriptional regulator AlpA
VVPVEHRLISAAAVRELCGGISDMSLWRWLNDPEIGFPKPLYIGRRRYWREAEIAAWIERQADETRAA